MSALETLMPCFGYCIGAIIAVVIYNRFPNLLDKIVLKIKRKYKKVG